MTLVDYILNCKNITAQEAYFLTRELFECSFIDFDQYQRLIKAENLPKILINELKTLVCEVRYV